MAKVYLDEIEFNSKKRLHRSKNLLSELDELDDYEVALPSSLYNKSKSEKKKEPKHKDIEVDNDIDDDWMNTLTSFKAPKTKRKSKSMFDGFDLDKKKKKKDKKTNANRQINHKKEFEPEMILLKNLQMEQSKFVDSLQKKYDQFENTKSTARGVGKFTTDLINSITSARDVSLKLIDKIISTKKTVADLDFKERKEFGSHVGSEQQNLANYASTYLKQVMTAGRNNVIGPQVGNDSFEDISSDGDYDDLFTSIDESLSDQERDEDIEKFIKYENDNVEIEVIWYDDRNDDNLDLKYDYIAYNKNGDIIEDYPLPEKTKLNINRTTGYASDIYGNKYKLKVV